MVPVSHLDTLLVEGTMLENCLEITPGQVEVGQFVNKCAAELEQAQQPGGGRLAGPLHRQLQLLRQQPLPARLRGRRRQQQLRQLQSQSVGRRAQPPLF